MTPRYYQLLKRGIREKMDKLLVTAGGLALLVAIYWFFLGKRDRAVAANRLVKVKVSGGYEPNTIIVQLGQPLTIEFLRTDPSDCLEEVVFPEFKIRKTLPLNQAVRLTITPPSVGEYEFVCGMGMNRGKLIVKEGKNG